MIINRGMIMNPKEQIDSYIAASPDWRGETLAYVRKLILDVDPGIIEEWKWMGSPVWELDGIICVGNIFKNKVQIVFMNGAHVGDPDKVCNAGLEGNQRRSIDLFEGDKLDETAFQNFVRGAIEYNQSKKKK
jgi:hypothetical protein